MIIADRTDEMAQAKWEHHKKGTDLEAIAWQRDQSAGYKNAAANSTAGMMAKRASDMLAKPESAEPTGMLKLIGSHERGAAMLDAMPPAFPVFRFFCRLDNVGVLVLEPTGVYERPVVDALLAAQLPMARNNAKQITQSALACGQLSKTDRIDAFTLADYGRRIDTKVLSQASGLRFSRTLRSSSDRKAAQTATVHLLGFIHIEMLECVAGSCEGLFLVFRMRNTQPLRKHRPRWRHRCIRTYSTSTRSFKG